MKTLFKLSAVALVTACCLYLSIGAIQGRLLTATEQEQSLADLLLQQQMQEQLAAAAAMVETQVETQNLVIEAEQVELKEPTIDPAPEVEPTVEEADSTPEAEPDSPSTQTTTDSDTPTITYTEAMDLSQIDDVEGYLIAHYFLNGYDYAAAETDPALQAEKELACAIEAYVIDTIGTLTGLTDVLSSFDLAQTQAVHDDMTALHDAFQADYGYLADDLTFGAIYAATDDYFVQATALTQLAVNLLTDFQTSTNSFLALSVLMNALDSQLYPQIDVVLDAVFTMKELTNAIYLQNTSATMLTKEDARILVAELETVMLTW